MRENGIKVIRATEYRATTDSDHRSNIAPNLLNQDVTADGAIFQYINGFYNPRRRHLSLGGKSPLAFERKAA